LKASQGLQIYFLNISEPLEPSFRSLKGAHLNSQHLKVGENESFDLTQLFQVAPLSAGHVSDVPAPGRGLFCTWGSINPYLHNERMGIGITQVHNAPLAK
jgi:hypothetical protein